jgi:serine/threonine-protein kinase
MRWVRGTDLQALILRSGRLGHVHAATIVAQVAAGLDAAHAVGLVHRDVKPANVLLEGEDGSGHVYLSDFGLTLDPSADTRVTDSGEWFGTVDFMAPEQFEGDRPDARTDVYALGCGLHAALTGEPPFPRGRAWTRSPRLEGGRAVRAELREPLPGSVARQPARTVL